MPAIWSATKYPLRLIIATATGAVAGNTTLAASFGRMTVAASGAVPETLTAAPSLRSLACMGSVQVASLNEPDHNTMTLVEITSAIHDVHVTGGAHDALRTGTAREEPS